MHVGLGVVTALVWMEGQELPSDPLSELGRLQLAFHIKTELKARKRRDTQSQAVVAALERKRQSKLQLEA